MFYIRHTIEQKLNRSILNEKKLIVYINNNDKASFNILFKNKNISFIIKKLIFKFLIFFSKNLRNKKKNIKNLVLFLKFYWYYNTFFFKNKILFFKKYFSKKNYNLPYLRNFFLNTKQIRLKPCLHRLKAKKIAFYKKYIWTKNKKFRKKNILIFNKKFFKIYNSKRFDTFFVDSISPFFRIKRPKAIRFLRKKLFKLLHKRYYYLFLRKHYIFNLWKKRRRNNKLQKKIISYNFRYKTYARMYVNKKFFANKRRKRWRQVYFVRRRRRIILRSMLFGFENQVFANKYSSYHLKNYLVEYAKKLAAKYIKDKKFFRRFFSKKKFKRTKNVLYFFKWKPKFFHFHSLCFFKKNKNIRKIFFSVIWLKFFYKKIFWKKRRNSKKFLLFFFNNFFFNKSFLLFNSLLRSKFYFSKTRRWKLRTSPKRRSFTVYVKRIRRRIVRREIKRKFVRFFIILLFFRFMKKHKKASRALLFKNSFFLSTFKKIKLAILNSVLLGTDSLYFKNNSFSNYDVFFSKKNLKIISLLKKNNF